MGHNTYKKGDIMNTKKWAAMLGLLCLFALALLVGCSKKENTGEEQATSPAKVANVFVYVKDGLGDRTFDVPKDAVTLDQKGCQYHPHVLGVMTGQNIEIKNDDPTTHNIHPTPKDNREWNESQPPNAAALEKSFAREEIMLPVKCNQHPWMKMYMSVV